MTEYVLCFVTNANRILFVRKTKPQWQAGLLNLPGGKVEAGETPSQAAFRELFEETNLRATAIRRCGTIQGKASDLHDEGWVIHVMRCHVSFHDTMMQKTDEPVMWLPVKEALHHAPLIPNLRVVIPLLLCQVEGWSIQCEDKINHSWTITLP